MSRRPPGVRRAFAFLTPSRDRIAREVDEELELHLEMVAATLRAEGWSEPDARAEALRRFGDLDYTRAYCRYEDARRQRDTHRMTMLSEIRQDLRYAFRSLRNSRGFAATALLTLALGVGATTAIFSVVRTVLLEPLPFPAADRVVRVWHANPGQSILQGAVSEPDFLDWKRESRVAASMGGYFYADGLTGLDLTGGGPPERINAALVTDGFFQTLGAPPLLGRTLRPEDHVPGRDRVAVLSHGLFMRRFGGDAAIVGSNISLNGEPFVVAGVMPPAFTYPGVRTLDAWIPVSFFGPEDIGRSRAAHFLAVIARLRPGAAIDQLQAELSGIAAQLERAHPENPGWTAVTTASIRDSIVGDVRRPLIVLLAAVGLVLLVTCVNLASLLLSRATARTRELALRTALGAGRGRLTRQLLTESLTLALLGGALGVLLATVALGGLVAAGTAELPAVADARVDLTVLGFALVVSVVAGMLFSILPTLRATGASLEQSLRSGGRGTVGGRGQRLRGALVVAEMALAVMLVAGAGLAMKSFARLVAVDPGFRPENVLVTTISIPDRYDSPEAMRAYYERVLGAVSAVRGVEAAGAIKDLPMRGGGEMMRPEIPGRSGETPFVQLHHVSAGYFRAMGIPLRAGRSLESTDRVGQPWVIVINEEMARRLWPGENAVGKTVRTWGLEIQVVGVVADVRQRGLAEPVSPAAYVHALQNMRGRMNVVVRTAGSPTNVANDVRQAIWSVDANQTITGVTTMEDVLGQSVARPRLLAWLLGLFGVVGLTLGAVGIYGVLAFAVTQRRQEFGVRIALGASPRALLRRVLGQGMALAGIGVVAGTAGALALAGSMRSVLHDVQPWDPLTFVQVVVVLLGAALLASWLPARRTLSIDPVAALRQE